MKGAGSLRPLPLGILLLLLLLRGPPKGFRHILGPSKEFRLSSQEAPESARCLSLLSQPLFATPISAVLSACRLPMILGPMPTAAIRSAHHTALAQTQRLPWVVVPSEPVLRTSSPVQYCLILEARMRPKMSRRCRALPGATRCLHSSSMGGACSAACHRRGKSRAAVDVPALLIPVSILEGQTIRRLPRLERSVDMALLLAFRSCCCHARIMLRLWRPRWL